MSLVFLVIIFFVVWNNIALSNNNDREASSLKKSRKAQWKYGFYEKLKHIVGSSGGDSDNKRRLFVRHRLINDAGIVVADEQPDLEEIRQVMADDDNKIRYDNKKISTTKYGQIPKRQKQLQQQQQPQQQQQKHEESISDQQNVPSIIEHDPTIDENAVGLSYKYYENSNERYGWTQMRV